MGIPPPGQCVNKFIFLGKKCIMFLTCSTFVQELPFHAWEQTYEDTMLFLATCCSLQICMYLWRYFASSFAQGLSWLWLACWGFQGYPAGQDSGDSVFTFPFSFHAFMCWRSPGMISLRKRNGLPSLNVSHGRPSTKVDTVCWKHFVIHHVQCGFDSYISHLLLGM